MLCSYSDLTASVLLDWQMDIFKEERRESPGARVIGKPLAEDIAQNVKSDTALQCEEDGRRQTPDSTGALELQEQVSSLKTELSRVIKVLSCYQTKQHFFKQTKSVEACLRLLQSHPDSPDGESGGKDSDNSELEIGSDSNTDSDSDSENKEQPQVRYERISYDGSQLTSISYQGNGDTGKVGSCQFLNKPVPHAFQYFEVTVSDYGRNGSIGIGLAHRSYPLDRMPGLGKGSVAYHCGKGQLFLEHGRGPNVTSPAQQGDIIGCGIKYYATSDGIEDSPIVFFTRNGEELGRKKMKLPKSGFFPIIGLCSEGEKVVVDWNVEWKLPEDVEDEDQSAAVEIEADTWQGDCPEVWNGRRSPQCYEEDLDRSIETKVWETSDFNRVIYTIRRSQLVSTPCYNLIEYKSDRLSGVGVYQYHNWSMDPHFSYYEVTVKDYGMNGTITVGLARSDYPLDQHPGWMKGSIAWHCDGGGLYVECGLPKATYTQARTGDIIGCGIDFEACGGMSSGSRQAGSRKSKKSHVNKVKVFFTHNGERIIEEAMEEPEEGFYPSVGMQSPGEMVAINTSDFISTVPTFIRKARVKIEGNFVSFVSNPNPYNEMGGIQLMQKSMADLLYFEVTIISLGEQSTIGIGIASKDYPLDCQPGWGDGSIAYHCNDGRLLWGNDKAEQFYSPSLAKDIIGCGIRSPNDQLQVFFTHNGREIGQKPFKRLQPTELYPTICMHSRGEKVRINVNARWDENREEPVFSRWEGMEIDGNKASYKPDEHNEDEVGAVQLSREISKKYPYFEIKVTSLGKKGGIGVGLAPYDYPLYCEPGWLPGSVGYRCDDGRLYEGKSKGKHVHEPGRVGDKLGCGCKFSEDDKEDKIVVFFTHNGKEVCKSELRRPNRGGLLFPTIGLASRGEAIEVVKDPRRSRGGSSPSLSTEETDKGNDHPMELLA